MAAERPVASIDCGTNSTRLLVLDGGGRRVDRRMRITRLGQGVDRTGRLDEEAVTRTLEVLREYAGVLAVQGVTPDDVAVAATSALRDADNAAVFLDEAEAVLGVRPSVIPGEEEGRLSYLGAAASLERSSGPYLVVDVGGGSTELIAGSSEPGAPPVATVSLDVGCVRVTERYLRSDPPTPAELGVARREVRALVEEAAAREPALRTGRVMVGLAGTVSALTVLSLGLDGFVEERVHHARLERSSVESLRDHLGSMTVAERRAVRGMEQARADVIVGGAVVLAEVMATFGFEVLTASESDILDGLASELLARRRPAG